MNYYDYLNGRNKVTGIENAKPGFKPAMPGNPNVGPQMPKVPKQSLLNRAGSAVGNFVKPALPYARTATGLGAVAGLGTELFADRDRPEADRTFPIAGSVADAADELALTAHKNDGAWAGLKEQFKAVPALAGGVAKDIYNRTTDFYGQFLPEEPGMELTPGAAADLANPEEAARRRAGTLPPRVDVPGGSRSTMDQYLINASMGGRAPEAPVAPVVDPNIVPQSNNSYFVNNGPGGSEKVKGGYGGLIGTEGKAPGEEQYFRNMPRAFTQQPTVQGDVPRVEAQPVGSAGVGAAEGLNMPTFTGRETYGELMGKRLAMLNEGAKLIPGKAREKAMAARQAQLESDRKFEFKNLEFGRDTAFKQAELSQTYDQMGATRRSGDLNRLARLRGQDMKAANKGVAKPMSFEDQLGERNAQAELSRQIFTTAPSGFAEVAPNLLASGATLPQIQDAINQVTAEQAAALNTTVYDLDVEKLDPQKFYADVAAKLGITQ